VTDYLSVYAVSGQKTVM